MAEVLPSSKHTDLVDAIREVLRQSEEPLTVLRIRERLRGRFRALPMRKLRDVLERQVAANVLVICPKYRSSQDRYWDRPILEHAKVILRGALVDGPMSWADLRKKFPKYLRHLAESVLNEELAKGGIHRHAPTSARRGPRYALQPADVRSCASVELKDVLSRLQERGFARADIREALMQLLQEEEWADHTPQARIGVLT
jgi:predicted Zn-ribbon and HTH transcriptional regulator